MVFLSIVIPTYNGKKTIKKVVESLERQSYPRTEYEIIVVDDGSVDGTKKELNGLNARYFRQEKKGMVAARNLGIRFAVGDYVLFLNDDTIAASFLVKEHIESLKEGTDIVVGKTVMHADAKNEFSDFLEKNRLLGFDKFSDVNVSVRKDIVRFGLDEGMPVYSLIDLMNKNKDKKMVFAGRALAYHLHRYKEEEFFIKMQKIGATYFVLCNRYFPEKMRKFKMRTIFFYNFFRYKNLIKKILLFLRLKKFVWKMEIVYNCTIGARKKMKGELV